MHIFKHIARKCITEFLCSGNSLLHNRRNDMLVLMVVNKKLLNFSKTTISSILHELPIIWHLILYNLRQNISIQIYIMFKYALNSFYIYHSFIRVCFTHTSLFTQRKFEGNEHFRLLFSIFRDCRKNERGNNFKYSENF